MAPATTLTDPMFIDIPFQFDRLVLSFGVFGRSYFGYNYIGLHFQSWHLVTSFGVAFASQQYNPLEVSLRFYQSEYHFPAEERFLFARRLAYVIWKINMYERWLKLPVTEFKMRDRLTQEKYLVYTDPPSFVGYTTDHLDNILVGIDDQIRQGYGGGPSGQGARHGYEHELIATARNALAVIISTMWADPPTGPGKGGAIFGARYSVYDEKGDRVHFTAISTGNRLCGGAKYPGIPPDSPEDLTDPDPQALTTVDTYQWDYADPDQVTVQGNPVISDHYLPIEKLVPSADEEKEMHKGYFERMRHQGGTTVNANRYPPDTQLFNEFNLHVHTIAGAQHSVISQYHSGEVGDSPADPPTLLIPPEGDDDGAMDQRYWVDDRENCKRASAAQQHDSDYFRWDNIGAAGIIIANTSVQGPTYTAANYLTSYARSWTRIGWETDVQGTPWKLSYWDWFVVWLGAIPSAMFIKGTLTTSVTGGSSVSGSFGIRTAKNDEEVAREMIKAKTEGFEEKIAELTDDDSVDFDKNISSFLQEKTPGDGALYFGLNTEVTLGSESMVSASCEVNRGPGKNGALLEAEFPDGQRISLFLPAH